MFAKFFLLLFVYLLTVVDFIILLIPFGVLILGPFFLLLGEVKLGVRYVYFLLFVIGIFVLLYLLFDFVFGFSVRRLTRNARLMSETKGMEQVEARLAPILERMGLGSVRFYLDPSDEVNAYAIGGIRRRCVVITKGLLRHIRSHTSDPYYFYRYLDAVLAHECSHLLNHDYLPGLLMRVNEQARRWLSAFLAMFFFIVARLFYIIPFLGGVVGPLFVSLHHGMVAFFGLFYRMLFLPLFHFMQRFFSRSLEYRCDRDAAYIIGGKAIAAVLRSFGESGYMTLFSTHPSTAARVRYVERIEPREDKINAQWVDYWVTLASFVVLLFLPFIAAYYTDLSSLYQDSESLIYTPIKQKLWYYYRFVMGWFDGVLGG